ncbi:DNA/RNA non-specific endonuclease domain-containing protein [Phthorimaea operculella]|nr:DNA/RNA non-specific endonuclease domain-containing protein [Phthorimaea operculella]
MFLLLLFSCAILASSGAQDRLFGADYCNSPSCVNRFRYGMPGETQRKIREIKQSHRTQGHTVVERDDFGPHSPYNSVAYTVVPNRSGTNVTLPLVVEATLTTTRPSSSRGSGDIPSTARNNVRAMYDRGNDENLDTIGIDVGHIVAYSNGGTTDVFNFAGQTKELNRGPWRAMETEINKWLQFKRQYATFAVAIEYDSAQPTRPAKFYVKVILFFERDGRPHSDLQDMVFNNV